MAVDFNDKRVAKLRRVSDGVRAERLEALRLLVGVDIGGVELLEAFDDRTAGCVRGAILRRPARDAGAAASVPMTAPVVVEPVAEPEDDVEELVYDAGELEDDIEELVYDDGDDDVEEPVYDDAVPTTPVRASNEDPFEF